MAGRSPIIALRKAIRSTLSADAQFVAALGGAKIYDEAPTGVALPYAAFTDVQWRDWSAQLSPGAEQILVLTLWSGQHGTREAIDLASRAISLLDEAALTLESHRLIDLRFVSLETKREQNGRLARANIRFRAVTEAL